MTYVERPSYEPALSVHDRFFVIGSCFADAVSERMRMSGIETCSNPFGTTYNPLSVCKVIERLAKKELFTKEELVCGGGLYHSFMHHGSFSRPDAQTTLDTINGSLSSGADALKRSDVVIITLGTAYVYELVSSSEVVNNCHKLPQGLFRRRMLGMDEIVDNLRRTLLTYLCGKRVLITVSPIRHRGDGLHGNTVSKSTLHVAVHRLMTELNSQHNEVEVLYFPAYEILLDELRDYRWYQEDLCHPSSTAADYIWDCFRESAFSKNDISAMDDVMRYRKLCAHRAIADTPENRAMLEEKKQRLRKEIETKYSLTL